MVLGLSIGAEECFERKHRWVEIISLWLSQCLSLSFSLSLSISVCLSLSLYFSLSLHLTYTHTPKTHLLPQQHKKFQNPQINSFLFTSSKQSLQIKVVLLDCFPDDLSFNQSGPLIGGSVAAFLLLVCLLAVIIITLGKKSWNKKQQKGILRLCHKIMVLLNIWRGSRFRETEQDVNKLTMCWPNNCQPNKFRNKKQQ